MTTIQIRIDEKLKKKAQKTANALGLDLSGAITMFLVKMVMEEGIPFEVRTENGYRLKNEARIQKEVEEALQTGKSYTSAEEAFTDVLGKNWKKK